MVLEALNEVNIQKTTTRFRDVLGSSREINLQLLLRNLFHDDDIQLIVVGKACLNAS